MSNKKENKKKVSRRKFIKTASAVVAGGAATAISPGISKAESIQLSKTKLHPEKLQSLQTNPETLKGFKDAVDDVVRNMKDDKEFCSLLLEHCDSVQLINLYNQHRSVLEPLLGEIDGRTKEGRYKKIAIAAELFTGVSGMDQANYVPGSEEIAVLDSGIEPSSTCSGCFPLSAAFGCCILHFWGWSPGLGCCVVCP